MLSRIRILILSILDPGSKNRKRGAKNYLLFYLFCSHKYHKIVNYFIFYFEPEGKNLGKNFFIQRIIELFTQKIVKCSQNYRFGIRDPRSGKNLFRIPGSKRHRIPDPDPQLSFIVYSRKKRCRYGYG
jgi:hypothetical protein